MRGMSDDLFDLAGKVAIVTGSSRGIGRAIATRYAQRGARVVISSRDAASCETVAQELRGAGGDAVAIAAHVGKRVQLEALVAQTVAHFGGIDILVANAAVNPYYGPLAGITDDAWDRIMNSNVRSTLWLANLAFPRMAERGGGAALFLSSIAGLSGTNVIGAYAVSKTALIGLARSLAVEWGPHGIRVNCIAPGIVKTDFARALWDNPEIAEPTIRRTALRRLADPDDIAGAAIYLAARAGAFVTGQTIVIDGGVTIDTGM
ncbi:dehydrogenase [Vulcanimicrobium alpinum]|uniref:Dehydrogenase n=2 Tax=Vulcanimicrobium alpinum TaxID=3016050 RepID=A0AAN2CBP8_UNVUL|nr:dehydrogenase [Vulcanimicrobium alpinum]